MKNLRIAAVGWIFILKMPGFLKEIPADELSERAVVETEEAEKPVIDKIVGEVAGLPGMTHKSANALFHPLRREIDREREAGRAAVLYPKSILKIAAHGIEEKYDLEQVGVLLAKGQKAIGEGRTSDWVEKIIVDGFEKGLKPTEIYEVLRE